MHLDVEMDVHLGKPFLTGFFVIHGDRGAALPPKPDAFGGKFF
jgi:hypothetical protein